MPDSTFIDTNVLIYLYSEDEIEKSQQALQCARTKNSWISTQVLNEVSNVLRRKQKQHYSDIINVIKELRSNFNVAIVTPETIEHALALGERYGYSFFDSLMLASALEHSCITLFSEDMQHGQLIEDRLTIVNPFQEARDLN